MSKTYNFKGEWVRLNGRECNYMYDENHFCSLLKRDLTYLTQVLGHLIYYHTCYKIWNSPFSCLLMYLKYWCMYGKQCRHWSDAAFCGVWSGSTLSAKAYPSQHLGLLRVCWKLFLLTSEKGSARRGAYCFLLEYIPFQKGLRVPENNKEVAEISSLRKKCCKFTTRIHSPVTFKATLEKQYQQHKLSHLMTKPKKLHVRPAKAQISLGIRPV